MLNTDGEWKVVKRRKQKSNYRYLGNTGICNDSEGKFKAAERRIPIFITRIHKDTTEQNINGLKALSFVASCTIAREKRAVETLQAVMLIKLKYEQHALSFG